MTEKFSIDAQIEELRMAIDNYPTIARMGGMSKNKVEFRLQRLHATLHTLEWVKHNQALFRWMKDNEAALHQWLAERYERDNGDEQYERDKSIVRQWLADQIDNVVLPEGYGKKN